MIEVCPDSAALARRAADLFRRDVERAVAARGAATVALAGGESPVETYRLLGAGGAARTPWPLVHLYWGDERCVPPDDPRSNFGLANDTFISRLALPAANLHRMHGEAEPEGAARAYEDELRAPPLFGSPKVALADGTAITPGPADGSSLPVFDLIFLGLGPDGHIASLFPHAPQLSEAERLCVTSVAPDGLRRISLTLPVLNAARHVLFLVNQAAKAGMVAKVIEGRPMPDEVPAQRIAPPLGRLTWLLTEEAAAGLSEAIRSASGPAEGA